MSRIALRHLPLRLDLGSKPRTPGPSKPTLSTFLDWPARFSLELPDEWFHRYQREIRLRKGSEKDFWIRAIRKWLACLPEQRPTWVETQAALKIPKGQTAKTVKAAPLFSQYPRMADVVGREYPSPEAVLQSAFVAYWQGPENA